MTKTAPKSRASTYIASHGFSRAPLTYAANMLAQFDGDAARAIDALAGYTLRPDYHAGVAAHLAAMGTAPNKRQRKAMRKSAPRTYTESMMSRMTGGELLEQAAEKRATAAHQLERWHGARHVSHAQDAKREADSAIRDCRTLLRDARAAFDNARHNGQYFPTPSEWEPEPAPAAPAKAPTVIKLRGFAATEEGAKVAAGLTPKTIDCTPTWAALVPAFIAMIENGTPLSRGVAIEELTRLAAFADSEIARRKATLGGDVAPVAPISL